MNMIVKYNRHKIKKYRLNLIAISIQNSWGSEKELRPTCCDTAENNRKGTSQKQARKHKYIPKPETYLCLPDSGLLISNCRVTINVQNWRNVMYINST